MPAHEVRIIRGGADYFDLLEQLINQARRIIHLQVYILEQGQTGKRITAALAAAAGRGVKVFLVADGYASQKLSQAIIREWQTANISFRFFEPWWRSTRFYFGRRMHHKVFVADDSVALVGGINISDRYSDVNGKKAWLDFALLLRGEICGELSILCHKTLQGFRPSTEMYVPTKSLPERNDTGTLVRMRRNDWVRKKNQISGSYIEMLKHARHEIIILCSYFIPGRIISRHLLRAARRGVKVKLILAGFSDVRLAKNAERYMYDRLLRNGIDIFEYKPTVLHGKVAVCDNRFMTLGSYNVNDISAYASIELNIDVQDEATALSMTETLKSIIEKDCEQIISKGNRINDNVFKQLLCWASYRIFRMALYLFTFYFKQQR